MLAGVGSFDKAIRFTAFLTVLVDVAAFGTIFFCVGESPTFRDRSEPAAYPVLPAIVLLGPAYS